MDDKDILSFDGRPTDVGSQRAMGSGPSLGNVFHGIMGSSQALVGNQMRKVVQHKIQKQASCRHAAQLPIKSLMSFCTKIWESAIEAVKR